MSLGRSRIAVAAVMSSSLLAGLAVAESSGATTPDSTSPGAEEGPVGVIAIGHSSLVGWNSDPNLPDQPALENSWATGTNPDVNSIYLRMVEARPETEGHVANTAVGGALARDLTPQAQSALSDVPSPELVIIQTTDNDIGIYCPLREGEPTAFGDDVARALDEIVETSPQSQILMVGPVGRPNPAFLEELVAAHPEAKPQLTGPGGECGGPFDHSGEINLEFVDTFTGIVDAYEAELKRRCDAFPQCHTYEGARAQRAYVELDNLSSDLAHLNVRGQAVLAELIWPVVADILGLDGATAASAVSSTEPES